MIDTINLTIIQKSDGSIIDVICDDPLITINFKIKYPETSVEEEWVEMDDDEEDVELEEFCRSNHIDTSDY